MKINEVSIIVPSFNKLKYLPETIQSVMAQSFSNWELIIVDDCSTDGTKEYLNDHGQKDSRFTIIFNESNQGANFCRNLGLRISASRYIIFLDADDILQKECLAERVAFMNKHFECDFSVSPMATFFLSPGDSSSIWNLKTKNPLTDFLAHNVPWQTMQPIWKKNFLEKIGGFDEQFDRLQDVDLHTRALLEPSVNFILREGTPDCSYRIDEKRLIYNYDTFFIKWVHGVLRYHSKFVVLIEPNLRKFLAGSLFQIYVHLLLAHKIKKISPALFFSLEKDIKTQLACSHRKTTIRLIFRFVRTYNLAPFRIPGFNIFLKKLLFL